MFITALFIIAKKLKQEYALSEDQINTVWCIYAKAHYTAITKKITQHMQISKTLGID